MQIKDRVNNICSSGSCAQQVALRKICSEGKSSSAKSWGPTKWVPI